jgi:hypothetical protein
MVVRSELAALPEYAFEGALLQARLSFASAVNGVLSTERTAASDVVFTHVNAVSKVTRRPRSNRARQHSNQEVASQTNDANSVLVRASVKPLRPFRVEVLDGHRRRVFESQPNGVNVDTNESTSSFFVANPSNRSHSHAEGSVVFRALIGKDGAPERLWKVSGPAGLTDEAMRIARGLQFGPYYQNGVPVEMEAIVTITLPAEAK